MKRTLLAAALAALSFSIHAQTGPGMGGSATGGPGKMMGPQFNEQTTPGWTMMTPEERKAHQEKMAAMHDKGECVKYMDEHHKQMQERAKAKGAKMGAMDADHGCGHMMMSKMK